jgi:hypothetical protein
LDDVEVKTDTSTEAISDDLTADDSDITDLDVSSEPKPGESHD